MVFQRHRPFHLRPRAELRPLALADGDGAELFAGSVVVAIFGEMDTDLAGPRIAHRDIVEARLRWNPAPTRRTAFLLIAHWWAAAFCVLPKGPWKRPAEARFTAPPGWSGCSVTSKACATIVRRSGCRSATLANWRSAGIRAVNPRDDTSRLFCARGTFRSVRSCSRAALWRRPSPGSPQPCVAGQTLQ